MWVFRIRRQGDDLQYDGVVKTNISERPVYYHHVCVKDLSSQLQQAEHCTTVKLYKERGGKRQNKRNIYETSQQLSFNCIT